MNAVNDKIDWKEIVKSCREMYIDQLMAYLTNDISKFWSWGSHARTVYRDEQQRVMMFRMMVNGHHHKGHVYIFLNGLDLFDVYLTTSKGTIKHKVEGLYFDQLVEWIDTKVERIPEYTD